MSVSDVEYRLLGDRDQHFLPVMIDMYVVFKEAYSCTKTVELYFWECGKLILCVPNIVQCTDYELYDDILYLSFFNFNWRCFSLWEEKNGHGE